MTETPPHRAARAFLYRQGRLLERRLYAALFEDAPAGGVLDALLGYRNDDGGFGHGLEPDKRCPSSLPIDVHVALDVMSTAGAVDEPVLRRACDFLAGVADPSGAVPLAFPTVEDYPRAEHWAEWSYRPGLFPTAGLAGRLRHLGVAHPWVDDATAYCWSALDRGLPDDAHALLDVLVFLEHAADRARAEDLARQAVAALPSASSYRADPDDPAYGVTPLHFVPTPSSRWRHLFDDDLVDGHLRRLRRDQQPDGGWPLTWQPPGEAATLEYRGMETLRALRVLHAYELAGSAS